MSRRLSATESVEDEIDLLQLFEAEMADAEAVAREAAGGGNDGDPVVRAGVINVSSSMEGNFLPDSLFCRIFLGILRRPPWFLVNQIYTLKIRKLKIFPILVRQNY